MTLEQIAIQTGCSASTVRRAARRMGLPPLKPGRPRITPQVDRDTLEAMIASGLSTAEIAEQVGHSVEVVRSWVRHYGLAFPQHSNRRPDPPQLRDVEWLQWEHHDHGRSITDIARELGSAQSTVRRRFREYGIPIRHQREYPRLRDAAWLEEQYTAGKSSRTIAGEVGCSEAAVRMAAISVGVTPRARRTPPG